MIVSVSEPIWLRAELLASRLAAHEPLPETIRGWVRRIELREAGAC
jgi:hypothetical protein